MTTKIFPKTVPEVFGEVLRGYRNRSGFSQEGLAEAAGLDRSFISMLERGERQPTLETLFSLARALDVAPSLLIEKTTSYFE